MAQMYYENQINDEVLVYEAPQVETIEVAVEKGFATSDGNIENPKEEEEPKARKGIFGRKGGPEGQQEINPDVIDANIFKNTVKNNEAEVAKPKNDDNLFTVEVEQKEEKTKTVLNLGYTQAVEDEVYEYPHINLLGKNTKKVNKAGAKD